MHKSTLLHLRIPFAFYLFPIFIFAASQNSFYSLNDLIISFIAIHLFLYPAANGYNSYFDKDKGSIGGLKNPPEVKSDLYYTAIFFDIIAILLGYMVSWQFALMLFIYGLESKAYSHPSIRLKKYAYISTIVTSLFQGGFAYMMTYIALHHIKLQELFVPDVLYPSILCSLSFLGFYPITQVYQHEQDIKNKEKTISVKLGLRGTFLFSTIVFIMADVGYYFYFTKIFYSLKLFLQFQLFLFPLITYYIWWYFAVLTDSKNANYGNTMLFYKIATICIVTFFIVAFFIN